MNGIFFFCVSCRETQVNLVLVSPKNPKPDDNNTWRLHVMNRPNPNRPSTQQEWVYDPLQIIGRTSRLLALVLLGKTEVSGEELSEMLDAVEMTQDDRNWDCTTWTLGAVRYMLNQGAIPPIPISLESLCDAGSQAAREFSNMSWARPA